MFKSTTMALALTGALILSGCATTTWQMPAHHPADSGAAAGSTPAITALERYRESAQATGTNSEPAESADDPAHEHHDHGGTHP
ncbi:MAG: hypothetical protein WDZ63_06510 [Burkholderiales bacterium]